MLKKLYIEPTTHCNLDCAMCFRNVWFDEPFCELSLADFRRVLDTMPQSVETLFFGGMGEPLCHADIFAMLQMASETGKNVELLTNGTLLSESVLLRLIACGLDRLWISIDNLDPDSALAAAGHAHAHSVIRNIDLFRAIRERLRCETTLGIAFVAMRSNVHQLARLPYFIARYLVDEVSITNLAPSSPSDAEEMLCGRVLDMHPGFQKGAEHIPVVRMPFMDMGIPEVAQSVSQMANKMNFHLYYNDAPVIRKSRYCRFINEGMAFVRSDGGVAPCMALLHNGLSMLGKKQRTVYARSFGNIKTASLSAIWNQTDYRDFRDRVKAFSFSPCIHCGHCELSDSNMADCVGNSHPTCGACLWSEGVLCCP